MNHAAPEVLASSAVVPALVNAHAHLDLTSAGCVPFGGDFDEWLAGVRSHRVGMDAQRVDASVQQGVTALRTGGVAAVGDIAGHLAPGSSLARLRTAGLGGVSFTELFGMAGDRERTAVQEIARLCAEAGEQDAATVRRGVQPHAPYSAGAEVFRAALRSGLPVSTHLAESPEETEFLRDGTGRFRALLKRTGAWDDRIRFGARHPVDWLADLLQHTHGARVLCAHCNCIDDEALARLATLPISVAYCPRASAYFGRTSHRYREMLDLGIAVALGTDSMMSLDTPDRLSTLDDARLLMRRDGLSIETALAMATVHGARALGLPVDAFTLTPSDAPKAGILQVPLAIADESSAGVIRAFGDGHSAPVWLADGKIFAELLPQAG
ncbi:MAG: amidohydrolase family protein [Phycisphaerae bacterium]|nr:amidohydrolase family protein [Phycisphaerae bacterium]